MPSSLSFSDSTAILPAASITALEATVGGFVLLPCLILMVSVSLTVHVAFSQAIRTLVMPSLWVGFATVICGVALKPLLEAGPEPLVGLELEPLAGLEPEPDPEPETEPDPDPLPETVTVPEPLPDPLEVVGVIEATAEEEMARQLVALVHATPMSGPALPLRVVG